MLVEYRQLGTRGGARGSERGGECLGVRLEHRWLVRHRGHARRETGMALGRPRREQSEAAVGVGGTAATTNVRLYKCFSSSVSFITHLALGLGGPRPGFGSRG